MGKWVPSADFKRFLERVARYNGNPPAESPCSDAPSEAAMWTRVPPISTQPSTVNSRGWERPRIPASPPTRDVMAQCPKCKTVETIQLAGDALMPSRKFRQKDGGVYHDCGSDQPCRLRRQS